MNKKKYLLAIFLIVFGVIGRIFLVEFIQIPNLEIITSLSLVAGVMLGGIFAFLVPLGIIAISDIYVGNTTILIFTWSAFAIIGIFGWLLRKRKNFTFRFIGIMTGLGLASSLFFYLYTNFGWWLLSNMYPHNWQGLVQCYLAGLPFLKNNLFGNLFFVPLFFSFSLFIWRYRQVLEFKTHLKNSIIIKLISSLLWREAKIFLKK